MSARTFWRYLRKMQGFSSRSSIGYASIEHSPAPAHSFSLDAKASRAAKLEDELRNLAFSVLRRLCGRIGHLPESYLLSDKFNVSGLPHASSGFADTRMGVFKRKIVAVKSLRISEQDDKVKIRKVRNQVISSRLLRMLTHRSTSVRRSPCGRTCPIAMSSILSAFLIPSMMGGSLWFPNG